MLIVSIKIYSDHIRGYSNLLLLNPQLILIMLSHILQDRSALNLNIRVEGQRLDGNAAAGIISRSFIVVNGRSSAYVRQGLTSPQ